MPLTAITGVPTTANTIEYSPANKKKNKKTRKKTNKKKKRMRLTANTLPAGVPTTANTVEDSPANKKKKKKMRLTANTLPAGVPTTANTVEDSPANKKKKKKMRLTANTLPAGVPTTANTVEDSPANKKKNKKTKRTAITGENFPADRKKKRMRLTANTVEDSPANKKKNKKKKRMRLTADKKRTANTVPADRKKRRRRRRSANTVPDGWKSVVLTAVTGEEMEAHKAEWTELLKSDPDRIPWKSKYGAGMDDETQWPPVWKERIEECPEYEVIEDYLKYMTDNENLVEQMRESRGYDVTASAYGFSVFCPGMVDQFSHNSTAVCQYVTDQINERAQKYGELYILDEVKKIAKARNRRYFYTFTVLEATSQQVKTVQAYVHSRLYYEKLLVYLKEWRFKPESLNLNQNVADAVDDRNTCFSGCFDCYDGGRLYPRGRVPKVSL